MSQNPDNLQQFSYSSSTLQKGNGKGAQLDSRLIVTESYQILNNR